MLLLAWIAGGCSSFNREWKRAATPSPTNAMTGRWEGTWHSDVNDHSGLLRCLVTPLTNGVYQARFYAKYKRGITFSFSYTAPLTVRRNKEVFQFEGEANLGWYAGGRYEYQGHADGMDFFSTYRSKHDHGTFRMKRPVAAE